MGSVFRSSSSTSEKIATVDSSIDSSSSSLSANHSKSLLVITLPSSIINSSLVRNGSSDSAMAATKVICLRTNLWSLLTTRIEALDQFENFLYLRTLPRLDPFLFSFRRAPPFKLLRFGFQLQLFFLLLLADGLRHQILYGRHHMSQLGWTPLLV